MESDCLLNIKSPRHPKLPRVRVGRGLESEGIDTFLENEHVVFTAPHLAAPSGVKLNVKPSDVERAMELLQAPE